MHASLYVGVGYKCHCVCTIQYILCIILADNYDNNSNNSNITAAIAIIIITMSSYSQQIFLYIAVSCIVEPL